VRGRGSTALTEVNAAYVPDGRTEIAGTAPASATLIGDVSGVL
jgi:hypothetical protein